MESDLKYYSQSTVNVFEKRVYDFFKTELFMDDRDSRVISAHLAQLLLKERSVAMQEIFQFVSEKEIRSLWNAVFSVRRAENISRWISSSIKGKCLDLLGGDGRIAEELHASGHDVMFTERQCNYPYKDLKYSAVRFIDFEHIRSLQCKFDTVILCTVLHHEEMAEEILDLAAELAIKRIIIVENAIYKEFNVEVQSIFDHFFNEGLNRTPLTSPLSHRTPEEWMTLFSSYGSVSSEFRDNVPGVPIPHHLFMVEIQ